MPVVVKRATRGKAAHCQRRVTAPISISTGSSARKSATICGANNRPTEEITSKKAVPIQVAKSHDSRTRP